MERSANYAMVGLFVLIFVSAIGGFVYWLGKYGGQETEYDRYRCYFTESVSGLNKEAAVKFKGVKIGSVSSLGIDPQNPERIEVKLRVIKGSPIKEDGFVTLGTQGLTGLAFIEISGGTKEAGLLKDAEKSEMPVIKTQTSTITKLTERADRVMLDVTKLLAKIDRVLSDKNIQNTESAIANLNEVTNELKSSKLEVQKLIAKGIKLEEGGEQMIEKLSASIDKTMQTVQNSNDMIDEMRHLSVAGQTLVDDIKQSPSDLLFKQKPVKLGPGESR